MDNQWGVAMDQSGGMSKSGKRGSVAQRFNRVLIGLYLVAIVIAAPAIYWVTSQQVYAQAERELAPAVDAGLRFFSNSKISLVDGRSLE